jgi:hypothetical protein
MRSTQPTLHEAMIHILTRYPENRCDVHELEKQNIVLELYRQRRGDGPYPPARQFTLRAKRYPKLFRLLSTGEVQYIRKK